MAGRRTFAALGLAATLLSGGCGTMDNVKRPTLPPPNKPDAKVCRIYGGLRGDFSVMTEFQQSSITSFLDYIVLPVLATTDLALDVVGDTITLPYTAVAEIRRAFYRGPLPELSQTTAPESSPVANPEQRSNGP